MAASHVRWLMMQLPPLAPLVTLLKAALHRRGLKSAFTGGLSSYALVVMVSRFLLDRHALKRSSEYTSAVSAAAAATGFPRAAMPPPPPPAPPQHPQRPPTPVGATPDEVSPPPLPTTPAPAPRPRRRERRRRANGRRRRRRRRLVRRRRGAPPLRRTRTNPPRRRRSARSDRAAPVLRPRVRLQGARRPRLVRAALGAAAAGLLLRAARAPLRDAPLLPPGAAAAARPPPARRRAAAAADANDFGMDGVVVVDPIDPNNNTSKCCYRGAQLQALFVAAARAASDAAEAEAEAAARGGEAEPAGEGATAAAPSAIVDAILGAAAM